MRFLISGSLIIVAIIHLLPLPGLLGNEQLSKLYGLSIAEPNLAILMRHRAVLFGLLGVFLLVAAFRPAFQGAALVMALVSVVSFLWLARSVGDYNGQIARVVAADVVALACIGIGGAAYLYERAFKW